MITKTNDITNIYPYCKKYITKEWAVIHFVDGSYFYTRDKLKNEWRLARIFTENGNMEL